MALLLAVDSWSDYHALARTIESAYDEALLEPLSALDDSVHFNADGRIDLSIPLAVQAIFESVDAPHKHLHVGLIPMDESDERYLKERTLIGVTDLPAPPPGGRVDAAGASPGAAPGAGIRFYDAIYRGSPVRVGALQHQLQDASGRQYMVRVQMAQNTDPRDKVQRAYLQRELWQDGRMLAAMVLLVWLGIAWALQPLKRLRASLRKRPAHNLQPLDPSDVPYEVVPLVEAVNHHIADHRHLLAEQGRFLADASHQLRTPLAIMMTQAGYALREHDPEVLRETLRAIVTQLGRSRRLSDQLLAMADAARPGDDTEPAPLIDLNSVAREVVLQYLPLAHERNQDLGWIDVHGEDVQEAADVAGLAAPVRAQAAELHEALANLLHNAIRHTRPGGNITVGVRVEGDAMVAEVCDEGPGIAPHLREAVFERFRRGKAPEAEGTGGAGLGLAIARAYARRNGGDIELADRAPGGGAPGLCARLRLPRAAGDEG
ncbi:MAG TPA: sensor histidine kinase [Ramlibacter sp.]|nr:sensor histidine kinase [Ramlibacter sp.]